MCNVAKVKRNEKYDKALRISIDMIIWNKSVSFIDDLSISLVFKVCVKIAQRKFVNNLTLVEVITGSYIYIWILSTNDDDRLLIKRPAVYIFQNSYTQHCHNEIPSYQVMKLCMKINIAFCVDARQCRHCAGM